MIQYFVNYASRKISKLARLAICRKEKNAKLKLRKNEIAKKETVLNLKEHAAMAINRISPNKRS